MIVVDTSVWIDFLNGKDAPHVRRLRAALGFGEASGGVVVRLSSPCMAGACGSGGTSPASRCEECMW